MEATALDSSTPNDGQTGRVETTIESLSKGIALGILVLYVCGFLITSLHDFRYGFSEMNPLRPRVLTAGAWFLLALALPFTLVRQLLVHKVWNSEDKWWFKAATLVFVYWTSCTLIVLCANATFVIDEPNPPPIPAAWKFIVGIPVVLVALFALAVQFHKIPKSIKASAFAIFFGYILWQSYKALVFQQQFQSSAFTLWMVGIGAVCLYEIKLRSWRARVNDWPQSFMVLLAALLLFATVYYPHIKASWGGGAPIPVSLTLSKDSVALPGQQIDCILVDETDSGFYVMGKGDKHATFIPRSSVALIHFADASETSLFTPRGK
jgi:hypothetical protein